MNQERRSSGLKSLSKDLTKKFGAETATFAHEEPDVGVISTGILSLDYASGIGGLPRRNLVGVYGPPGIGKSTVIGFSTIKSVINNGGNAVIVNVEPKFDREWAHSHGIDTSPKNDNLLILRPKNGEEAFEQAYIAVNSGEVDFVLFDSIGALTTSSEMEADAKARMGGRANLISFGVNRLLQPTWHNNSCVMFVNQIRDIMNARVSGLVQQPGGHALQHAESVIIELKRQSAVKFTTMVEGSEVIYGYGINATFTKNSWAHGNNRKTSFNFYNMKIEGEPFGVDVINDYINTAKRLGIVEGTHIKYDDQSFHGAAKFGAYLTENEDARNRLRDQVFSVMKDEQKRLKEEEKKRGEKGHSEEVLARTGSPDSESV